MEPRGVVSLRAPARRMHSAQLRCLLAAARALFALFSPARVLASR